MPFRQYPQPGRRYFANPYAAQRKPAEYPLDREPFLHGLYEDIPLPNQAETSRENDRPDAGRMPSSPQRGSSILDFFRDHIKLEEVILVGLIFLLLSEAIEDDLLLIILVYILLF